MAVNICGCKTAGLFMLILTLSLTAAAVVPQAGQAEYSEDTYACLGCHEMVHPGLVQDWVSSRHAATAPSEAMMSPALKRRISAAEVPEELKKYAVGCYECHSLNADKHKDNFEHFGYEINVIVTPNDCKVCHPVEVDEYSGSKKAHALDILDKNPVYTALVNTLTGVKSVGEDLAVHVALSENAKNESCYACHGTRVTVSGMKTIDSSLGELDIPILENWPNQGVGRINPDGSYGACTSCHPRHSFSIEIARKPYTCAQCHLEPDVPAYNVYKESKHGNIFSSNNAKWNFDSVPWKIGVDFNAPTCAVCHNSLLVTAAGDTIVERSHDFGARLWVRIFGLIYSHPQPKDGMTYLVKNKDGQTLATTFGNEPALEFLIDEKEQMKRKEKMTAVCTTCHNSDWSAGYFAKFDKSVKEADAMVLATTNIMKAGWGRNLADPKNPFDETLEYKWIKQWLFYANSLRYAAAMSGPDYAAFKNGWFNLSNNLQEMREELAEGKEDR